MKATNFRQKGLLWKKIIFRWKNKYLTEGKCYVQIVFIVSKTKEDDFYFWSMTYAAKAMLPSTWWPSRHKNSYSKSSNKWPLSSQSIRIVDFCCHSPDSLFAYDSFAAHIFLFNDYMLNFKRTSSCKYHRHALISSAGFYNKFIVRF